MRRNRRDFVRTCSAASLLAATPMVHAANTSGSISVPNGVASGSVTSSTAVVWSRSDRPARMFVEVADNDDFRGARRIRGPAALEQGDFTGKVLLTGLNAGSPVFYRVLFEDLAMPGSFSDATVGSFTTATKGSSDINFVWSGDTAGQGFGIDVNRGGMRTYETMRKLKPDFFVHSGDVVYADGPFEKQVKLKDGTTWENLTLDGTHKVAETLEEFHANFRYNLLDENVRRFNAEIPMFAQWDDHETTNNWYPGEQLVGDTRYTERSASVLSARAKRAFFDYMPMMPLGASGERIYRTVSRGPLLDLHLIDMRTYRGVNSKNRQSEMSDETALLGRQQLDWLKRALTSSKATWQVVCSDMPIGLIVGDGKNSENMANGDGPPLGRELELAELLSTLKASQVRNVIWITADVHYAASHHYAPERAQFKDFDPFWEFVSGPLHAGTFGPGKLDDTFGPEVRFCSLPDGMKQNRPPSDGFQFFGHVHIDAATKALTVSHYNVAGDKMKTHELPANG
ncbi:MAG: alkaline phosphatase D family protein [Planctomycetota bacterium]